MLLLQKKKDVTPTDTIPPSQSSQDVEPMDVDISDSDSQLLDTEPEESIPQQQQSTSSSACSDAPAPSSLNGCSASKCKLDSYDINYDSMEDTATDTGYIFVSKSSIKSLLVSFPCPACDKKTQTLRESISVVDGCNANFDIICLSEVCVAEIIQKWCTSESVGDRRYADVN